MSYYATIDDNDDSNDEGTGGDVATTSGWAEFVAWVDEHDVEREELRQLAHHGLSEDLKQLADEIKSAITDEPPSEDVAGIARGLLAMIDKIKDPKAVMTISN